MGMSGLMGKVWWVDDHCPGIDCSHWGSAAGTNRCWHDEVTRFDIVDSVNKREYGHDKSRGWQDVVAGIRRLSITLTAMWLPGAAANTPLRAGRVLFLELYPTNTSGGCATPLKGFAMIDQVSYTVDIERGEPLSYTATFSSKGPWLGFASDPTGVGLWGGFECQCGSAS